eukprot:gene7073-4514_t
MTAATAQRRMRVDMCPDTDRQTDRHRQTDRQDVAQEMGAGTLWLPVIQEALLQAEPGTASWFTHNAAIDNTDTIQIGKKSLMIYFCHTLSNVN